MESLTFCWHFGVLATTKVSKMLICPSLTDSTVAYENMARLITPVAWYERVQAECTEFVDSTVIAEASSQSAGVFDILPGRCL